MASQATIEGRVCAGISLILIIGLVSFWAFSGKNEEMNYGIFANKPLAAKAENSRCVGDMRDIAILLECTSFNDTQRWIEGISRQSPSRCDLPMFLFTKTENFTLYSNLKKIPMKHANLHFIQENGHSKLIDLVLKHPVNYVIEIKDTQFMGADFGDYYHFGRKVVDHEDQVSCVCGGVSGQNDTFFDADRGNVFWYQDQGCQMGPMRPREFYEATNDHSTLDEIVRLKSRICLYPEVGRVTDNVEFVSQGYWAAANLDETLWSVENYRKRILNDLKIALPMNDMDLINIGHLDPSFIHYYRYTNLTEINDLLGENRDFLNSRYFETVIPISYEGRCIYFISDDYYRKIAPNL